jgi:hypothetical protein
MHRIHVETQSNLPWAAHLSNEQLFGHHRDQLDHTFRFHRLTGEFSIVQNAFKIVVPTEVDRSQGEGPLIGIANAVLLAAQAAGLGTMRASITQLTGTWAATAAAGAATGLRLSKGASAAVQFVAFVGGGLIGAAAGSRIAVEVPIYRLQTDIFGNLVWVRNPPGFAMPPGLALR